MITFTKSNQVACALSFFFVLGAVSSFLSAGEAGQKIRVACLGDSITYGYKIENRMQASYPVRLQALLGEKYEVRNFGSLGAGVIEGTSAFIGQKEHEAALAFEPHVLICNFGINDTNGYSGKRKDFTSGYLDLLEAYKNLPTNPKIFIWTKLAPLQLGHALYDSTAPFLMRRELAEIAHKSGANSIDMYTPLYGQKDIHLKDHLHPNSAGYTIIAEATHKRILPYLTGDFGGLKLPKVFAHHMVLQRDQSIPVWGMANAGQKVTVTLAGKSLTSVTDQRGHWRVDLPAIPAGGPYQLKIDSGKKLTFNNVLVGDVWLCAGQSNMEFSVRQSIRGQKEISQADVPNIRLLNYQNIVSLQDKPWTDLELSRSSLNKIFYGSWRVCSPKTVRGFSAVGYYFGKELYKELQVPIGLIKVSIGGAPVEAFISEQGLLRNEMLSPMITSHRPWWDSPLGSPWCKQRGKIYLARWIEHPVAPLPGSPFEPTFLYRSGIKPLIPYAIRGVIWYQGEANASDSTVTPDVAIKYDYVKAGFETLIGDWRAKWGQGNFPFIYVQLPNMNRPWMIFRDAQLDVLKSVRNTGMAVTIDLGHSTNVHPKGKYEVGRRLALWALAKNYGKEIIYSGPLFSELKENGAELEVSFKFTANGLKTSDGKAPRGFEVAGADGEYRSAQAKIQGDKIVLRSTQVAKPTSARYAWAPNPDCNLINSENLPASPFRSHKR